MKTVSGVVQIRSEARHQIITVFHERGDAENGLKRRQEAALAMPSYHMFVAFSVFVWSSACTACRTLLVTQWPS